MADRFNSVTCTWRRARFDRLAWHVFGDGAAPRGQELVEQATLPTGVLDLAYRPKR